MILATIDPTQEKGWFVGPWNSSVPIPVGYANTGIDLTHYHATMYEIYLIAKGTSTALVNGQAVPLRYLYHYDNPYCVADLPAANMAIQFQDQQMQLVFAEPA